MAPGALSSFPNINRVLNLIQDADKSKRRNAISIIKSEVDSKLAAKEAEDIETLLDILAPQLSHALSDTVESHREMIIEILMKLISEAECIEKLVPHLLPVLVRRVAEKESVEPAEELRFGYLTVLHNIVEKCKNNKSYSTEYMLILKSSVADSYPEVKKLAFLLLRILAIKLEQAFYVKSEDIIDPIVENITHQHSKIRQEAIKTIGVVMMNSPGKHVEKIIPPLTQRLFDPSPAVRKEVIDVVGSWLLNLTDRYSYHLRLIPLLLTGQQDEFYEIRELSRDLWHDVGIKFEKENEEQLKDKLDFPIAPPDFYPSYSRPNFGCRELVHRNVSRLLPAACRDLADWQASTRSKAAGLIPCLLLHLETANTQYTQISLSGLATGIADAILRAASSASTTIGSTGSTGIGHAMPLLLIRLLDTLSVARREPNCKETVDPLYSTLATSTAVRKAEVDEAVHIIHDLSRASFILGYFVEPKIWWTLLHSGLSRCHDSTNSASLSGHLFVLAALLSNCKTVSLFDQLPVKENLSCSSKHPGASPKPVLSPDNDIPYIPSPEPSLLSSSTCTNTVPVISLAGQITIYLSSEEMISSLSPAVKTALLDCLEQILTHLLTHLEAGHLSEQMTAEVSRILSDVFYAIQGLTGIWPESIQELTISKALPTSATSTSDFPTIFLRRLHNGALTRLSVCQAHLDKLGVNETSTSVTDLERLLFVRQLPMLLKRLHTELIACGGWHPRSAGLIILQRALLSACPALTAPMNRFNPTMVDAPLDTESSLSSNVVSGDVELNAPDTAFGSVSTGNLLSMALNLLEVGCRLYEPPGTGAKDPSDPITLAGEAELRLRGLLLLARLTNEASFRAGGLFLGVHLLLFPFSSVLNPQKASLSDSSNRLAYCLTRLILPACVWRAGRTAEAMRKAAATSLLAVLASVADTTSSDCLHSHHSQDGLDTSCSGEAELIKTDMELDTRLYKNTETLAQFADVISPVTISSYTSRCPLVSSLDSCAKNGNSLSCLPTQVLGLLMTRLSGLLEDDLATTRQLACRSLDTMFSLLYNGLGHILAAHPANWLVPVSKVVSPSTVAISAKSGSSVSGESAESLNFKDHFEKTEFSRQVAECCPLPGALGDQIYRYYPNLLNRLDDANDEVRILTTEVLISWNYLMLRQLTEPASTDISHSAVSDHSGSLTESAVVTAEAPKSSDSLPSSVPVLRQRRVRSVHSAVLDDLISKIVVHLDDPEAKIRGAVARVLLRLGRHFSKKSVFRALSKARECHRSVDVCEALENLLIASA